MGIRLPCVGLQVLYLPIYKFIPSTQVRPIKGVFDSLFVSFPKCPSSPVAISFIPFIFHVPFFKEISYFFYSASMYSNCPATTPKYKGIRLFVLFAHHECGVKPLSNSEHGSIFE